MSQISDSLKVHRKGAGFRSAAAFAEAVQIPFNVYKNYEAGRSALPIDSACKICDYLNITLDELVGRNQDKARSRVIYAVASMKDSEIEIFMRVGRVLADAMRGENA